MYALRMLPRAEGPLALHERIPESSSANGEGVLILPCAPWESQRASWLQKHLEESLCRLGYRVMRCDYSGTGDSPLRTERASWSQWCRDALAARDALRELSPKIHAVGVRMGSMTLGEAARDFAFRSLHLLDPVVDGGRYLRQLERTQSAFVEELKRFGAHSEAATEILGFPLGLSWEAELTRARLEPKDLRGRRFTLYSSGENDEAVQLVAEFSKAGKAIVRIPLAEEFNWTSHASLQRQCFAQKAAQAIVTSIGEL